MTMMDPFSNSLNYQYLFIKTRKMNDMLIIL